MNRVSIESAADQLVAEVAKRLNQTALDHIIKDRADGPYLVMQAVHPSEYIFRALREGQKTLDEDHPFKERATIQKRHGSVTERIQLPETRLLRTVLSESLTVDQHTFGDDFFSRYIPSVFGYEEQIVSESNYLVYGRRGSGKSSLLAYAKHRRQVDKKPYAWVAMQPYAKRDDIQVSMDVFRDILDQLSKCVTNGESLRKLARYLDDFSVMEDSDASGAFTRILPRIAREIANASSSGSDVVVFLDDIHVLSQNFQPQLLGHLYSISRGNRCSLKISGIEQFSRPWNAVDQVGLQSPHDAQILKLDYNLTMPEKSKVHIENILDAHAKFCGLPGVRYISGDDVLSRLVWVAAAVPRDALHIFAKAITRASSQSQKKVSITSINLATSEIAEHKMRDVEKDHSQEFATTRAILEKLKEFCIKTKRKNAFLLEIKNDDQGFACVQDLIALRLVHVLHEGITPHEAGRRYQALMLDYGFYVGIRAARSVDLFQKTSKMPSAKDLRNLPVFKPPMACQDNSNQSQVGVQF